MVGAQLHFETVGGEAKGASHHSGIGNDEIEWLAQSIQPVSAGPHAGEGRKVELGKLETT